MTTTLLLLAWLTPLLLTPWVRRAPAIGILAPLPALMTAFWVPVGSRIELPWLLLGASLGIDAPGRIVLGFTALLWLIAAIHAAWSLGNTTQAGRFQLFFMLALTGNLWLILGLDLASFYTGFALMGLASYGLVIHDGRHSSVRAGQVYLILTLLGEAVLFMALVLIAHQTGQLRPDPQALAVLDDLAIGLLILGLAVKAGLMPLHVWLPLAHPAAPVPASAVLSGAMIKASLLGWLRFLPLGALARPDWGLLLVLAGLLTTLLAPLIGLTQTNPKVVLAYSSVAKMGLMGLGVGILLLKPELASTGIMALALYAAHHAFAKGGLFLGVGLRHHAGAQGLIMLGLAILALALAGAPLTSGALAKDGLKPLIAAPDWPWLAMALLAAAIVSALLMGRFVWLMWHTEPHPQTGWRLSAIAWVLLIGAVLALPLAPGLGQGVKTEVLGHLVPLLIAAALALPLLVGAHRCPHRLKRLPGRIPPGDLLAALSLGLLHFGRAWRRLRRRWSAVISPWLDAWRAQLGELWQSFHDRRSEDGWDRPQVAGLFWLILLIAIGWASSSAR